MEYAAQIALELRDDQWPLTTIDHDRQIARAIVVDDDGFYYFARLERDDEFGPATLIETSGGGVEPGEDPDAAIKRELREELGAEADILCPIGVVSDYYNLIMRHNINRYFLCRVRSFGPKSLTEDESAKFHLSTLKLRYEEAVAEYERRACTPLGRLIAARELPVLRRAKRLLEGRGRPRLWCFGDSNTYGYDPRSFSGGRYPSPWPELLAEQAGAEVVNDGRNGRTIPGRDPELEWFCRDARQYAADALIVMLGTNDLLNGASPEAAEARMEAFLARCSGLRVLLVSPPPLQRGAWVGTDALVEASRGLASRYRALADRLGLDFADAGNWGIGLAYDGVHFSEAGHRRFAQELAPIVCALEL